MKILFRSLVLSLAVLSSSGCGSVPSDSESGCPLPPEGIGKIDLIGTWKMETANGRKDLLIFDEHGQFIQVVEAPDFYIEYESDWQDWWIEFSHEGMPQLHLSGMSLCGWAPDEVSCEVSGSGQTWWFDVCSDNTFQMPEGEIVLFIERFDLSSKGIALVLPSGYERSWYYLYETSP
jgi:hypothetical protein